MNCHLPSSLRPEPACPIVSTQDNNEFREVVVAEAPKDHLVVYEFTSGPLTQDVYCSPWREHRVALSCTDAAFLLGPCPKGPTAALITFMQSGERHLSDLMDLLDEALVPYRYELLLNGHELVSRESCALGVG